MAETKKKVKTRWDSAKRLKREQAKKNKPDRIRWTLHFKKIKEVKEANRKKRKTRKENHQKLVDKGVIKVK